jgi:hypothetical protein
MAPVRPCQKRIRTTSRDATAHDCARPDIRTFPPCSDQAGAAASELARMMWLPNVLYRAIPVGYNNLGPSASGGAHFELDPLGHDHNIPPPSH